MGMSIIKDQYGATEKKELIKAYMRMAFIDSGESVYTNASAPNPANITHHSHTGVLISHVTA